MANSGKWKDGSKINLENRDGNSSKIELKITFRAKLDLELVHKGSYESLS